MLQGEERASGDDEPVAELASLVPSPTNSTGSAAQP
jgi:hypothetical protein